MIKEPLPLRDLIGNEPLAVELQSSAGHLTIVLSTSTDPHATNVFANLVLLAYYDELPLYRLDHGFVAQWGNPQGSGGALLAGDPFTIEDGLKHPPSTFEYQRGDVALVGPPGEEWSQFSVCLGALQGVAPIYPLVGRIRDPDTSLLVLDRWRTSGISPDPPIVVKTMDIVSLKE